MADACFAVISEWSLVRILAVDRHGAAMPGSGPGPGVFDRAWVPNRVHGDAGEYMVCEAPGRWLAFGPDVVVPPDSPDVLVADIGDGAIVLRLHGARGEAAVAALCPLDRAIDLAPGRAVRSLMGDADVTLMREGHDVLLIAEAALAGYLAGLLARF